MSTPRETVSSEWTKSLNSHFTAHGSPRLWEARKPRCNPDAQLTSFSQTHRLHNSRRRGDAEELKLPSLARRRHLENNVVFAGDATHQAHNRPRVPRKLPREMRANAKQQPGARGPQVPCSRMPCGGRGSRARTRSGDRHQPTTASEVCVDVTRVKEASSRTVCAAHTHKLRPHTGKCRRRSDLGIYVFI